jgi:hypothetical protein
MSTMKLAADAIYSLQQNVREQYTRQHKLTQYYEIAEDVVMAEDNQVVYPRTGETLYGYKKQKSGLHSRQSINESNALNRKQEPRIYIPRVMADLMQATTANSTSIHFGIGHMCHTHNKVYTVDHIAECNQLEGCESIPKYAQMLKEKPF